MFESTFNILNKTTFKQKALISCFVEYDKSRFRARTKLNLTPVACNYKQNSFILQKQVFLKIFPFQQKKFPSKSESFAYMFVVFSFLFVWFSQQLIQIKRTARIPATLSTCFFFVPSPPHQKANSWISIVPFGFLKVLTLRVGSWPQERIERLLFLR